MTSTPPGPIEIGTLIVVILKARNLPNKRHLGKQAPYCTVLFNGETRRTKVIKRGGQHPEWDEEIRFVLFEDQEPLEEGVPPPPPPKDGKVRRVQGGETMHLSCFADDPREPDLIGETKVDLTEVLTKGETDEWFTLTHRDRYCGEVYLELTFWSNAPPPQKKPAPVSQKVKQEYGGTGEFTPLHDEPPSDDFGRLDAYMETIRPSNSTSRMPLYMPSYEPRAGNHLGSVDQLVNDFGELVMNDHSQRSSTYPPPPQHDYPGTVGSTVSYPPPDHRISAFHNGADGYASDSSIPGHGPRTHRLSDSSARPYAPYQAPYEQAPLPSSSFSHHPPPPARRPRYSMPVSSSGFMPMSSSPDPSGFVQHNTGSQMMDGSGISQPPSRMSMSSAYGSAPTPAPVRGPRHSYTTPAPSSSFSHLAPSSSVLAPSTTTASHLSYASSFHVPAPQQPVYGQPPSSAPPVQYPPPPPSTLPAVPHSAPPQSFQNGSPQHIIPPHVPGSRPLPLPQGAPGAAPPLPPPQGYYQPPVEVGQHSLPTPPGPPGPLGPSLSYDRIPPPPPLISNGSASSLSMPSSLPGIPMQRSTSGRPSLPLPPGPPSQPSAYQSLPPPPPPPPLRRSSSQMQLPSAPSGMFGGGQPVYPGPPPRPPAQMLGPPAGQYSSGY